MLEMRISVKQHIKQIQCRKHEVVIDRHKQRIKQKAGIMKKRGALIEHPFGVSSNIAPA